MFKGIDYKWLVDQWNMNKVSLFSLFMFLIGIFSMYSLYSFMKNEKISDEEECRKIISEKNNLLKEKDKKIMEMYDELLINNNLRRANKLIDTIR